MQDLTEYVRDWLGVDNRRKNPTEKDNGPQEIEAILFSSKIVRNAQRPEKRKFQRETLDATLILNGDAYEIADISVSGLKIFEKISFQKGTLLNGYIICKLDDKTYAQKVRLNVVNDNYEKSTRLEIAMLIGSSKSTNLLEFTENSMNIDATTA